MHSAVYVIIDSTGDIDCCVMDALDPLCEDNDVSPYKKYLCRSEITSMAENYNVPEHHLWTLARHMPDWSGSEGGVDENGLFRWSTVNPDGKWDWYVIGGRFDGYIHGQETEHDPYDDTRAEANTVSVKQLLSLPDASLLRRLPASLLSPDGQWLDRSPFVDRGWNDYESLDKSEADWLSEVRTVFAEFPSHRAVCVDTHS